MMQKLSAINDRMTPSAKSCKVFGFIFPAFSPRDNMVNNEVGLITASRAPASVSLDDLQTNNAPGRLGTSSLKFLLVDHENPASIYISTCYGTAFRIFSLTWINKILNFTYCADNSNGRGLRNSSALRAAIFRLSLAVVVHKLFAAFHAIGDNASFAFIPNRIKALARTIFSWLIFGEFGFEKPKSFSARLANMILISIGIFSSHKYILHWFCRLFCLETAAANGGQIKLYHSTLPTTSAVSRQFNYTTIGEVCYR